jgi:tRNA pseudouridine38-40 synthase
VDAGFDARFSATWRRYHYLVRDDPVPDPFTARVAWWVREPLDVAAMELAARSLRGEHDFSSFCRRPDRDPPASLVRRVLHTEWSRTAGGLARFEIVATAFCHQMVRSVVGTLVAVGRGRLPVGRVQELLAARDRAGTPNLAPPHGLTLDRVGYEPWPAGFAGGSG